MSFDLPFIAISILLALLYAALPQASWRRWFLLLISCFALFWLQPQLPLRFGGYLLPLLTLLLVTGLWYAFIRAKETRMARSDWLALLLAGLVALLVAQARYLNLPLAVYGVRPPPTLPLVAGVLLLGLAIVGAGWLIRRYERAPGLPAATLLVVLLFIVWKSEPLAETVSLVWRRLASQDTALASALDLRWLGFSYIAFRLIHTLREKQIGNLPPLSLVDYLTYIIFFAALPAGPIDRAERFQSDLQALSGLARWDAARFQAGFGRIAAGLAKKFVLADSLAIGLSLNAANAAQATSTAGLWLLLYGYALRLYLDFSGYSDIAIGIGRLFGIQLPENFDWPYLQKDLASFWQRWHMTLSDWVRHYIFSPFSRTLLRRQPRPSPTLIVLAAQLVTMGIIGIWHGISWNFLIWGLWHGVGLFLHKQWSDRTRRWHRQLQAHRWRRRLWAGLGWALTFHYVVVGWVWFVLPDTGQAARTLLRLAGLEVLP